MLKKTSRPERQIFAYRWGTNGKLWKGGSPSKEEALNYLRKVVRSGRAPMLGWQVGPKGRTPKYAKILRTGDVLLFYVGAKFEGHEGVYGIALAGTDADEKAGRLAVPAGENRLKFRWPSNSSKALADKPFKGHDELFAPSGPASTLRRLKTVPQEIRSLVDKTLIQVVQHPTVKPSIPTESQEPAIDRLLKNAIGQLQDLPQSDRVRKKREIMQAVRSALLRPRVCKLWGYACAACGLSLSDDAGSYKCEVAHVREVWDDGKDVPSNTLPLCRTHHWAFDQHLWCIEPDTLRIDVRKSLRRHLSLKDLHGRKLSRHVKILATENLKRRWQHYAHQSTQGKSIEAVPRVFVPRSTPEHLR